MALKTCPHCGHSVSNQATKCPACGKDPRFTAEELEQQEQQHKKKRKTIIISSVSAIVIALAVLCWIFIPRCVEYNKAMSLFNSGKYTAAVETFDALRSFKDSEQKALDARYQYVCTHQIRTDLTTLKYVEKLVAGNYPNIQQLSDSIYKWTCNAYTTDTEGGNPITRSFGIYDPLYFMLKVYGGKPDEKISVSYRMDFYVSAFAANLGYSNDSEYGSVPDEMADGSYYWLGWEDGICTARYNYVKITFYNADTNTMLTSAEAYIYY